MARNSIWRKTFSRDADFIVGGKSFLLHGEEQRPGEPFDKTKVKTRMLRALYEQRKIFMVGKAVELADEQPPQDQGGGEETHTEDLQGGESATASAGTDVDGPAVQQAPEDPTAEAEDANDDASAQEDGSKAYVKHIGRGTYGVFIGADRMAGPLTKEEAQAEADKLNG